MSKKKLTIKDIAKLAGVSIATVSRVINRNGKVAPETEKKILQVMEENHYVPNLLAKGFRTQKFTTIGIIVPDISIEFFSKIAKKVQTIFFEKGYATIICNTNEDYKMERQCINMLQAQHVGGIIHIVSVTTEKEKKTSIPTVYMDREPAYGNTKKDMVLIESDNVSGGYQVTNEMIKNGCKNIICFCPKDKGSTHIKRWEGYCKAMEETGGKPRLVSLDNVSEVDAYEKAIELFGKDKEIDGVFATTDLIAIGVLKALKELKNYVNNPEENITYLQELKFCYEDLITVLEKYSELFRNNHITSDELEDLKEDISAYYFEWFSGLASDMEWLMDHIDTVSGAIEDIKELEHDYEICSCDQDGILYNGAGKKIAQIEDYKTNSLKYNSIKKDDDGIFYAYDKNNEKIGKVRFIK